MCIFVSVISHSDFHDLSNLSNGGPPVSPNRLTLSPPSRGGLSPQYRPALSPSLSTNLIPATVPTSPPQPSSLHELLSRGQQQNQVRNISSTSSQSPRVQVPDPIRSRSNSNQFKSAKRPIAARQRNSLSISNPILASQLSKSAPVKNLPLDNLIWNRREPRPHMNSICSIGGDSSIADEVSDVLNSLRSAKMELTITRRQIS